MKNVIQLPDKPVREWLVVEKALRANLAETGASQDIADSVCSAIRPIFLKYAAWSFVQDASMDPDEVMNALNAWIHQLTTGLLMELAAREVELFQLRGKN